MLFELDDLLGDHRRQFGRPFAREPGLQSGFALLLILADPAAEPTVRHPHFRTDLTPAKAFLQVQPDGFDFFGGGVTPRFFRAASPPRGAVPLLLYYRLFIHVNTPFIIGVSTTLMLKSVS